jgi:hypothetical protein
VRRRHQLRVELLQPDGAEVPGDAVERVHRRRRLRAPDPSGDRYVCADGNNGLTCQPVGDGSYGALCEADADCVDTVCRDGRCTFDLACQLPGDGSGPCIEAPDGVSCQVCLQDAITGCYSSCPTETNAFINCVSGSSCEDATCLLEECGTEFCGFFTCAEDSCPLEIRCF